MAHERTTFFTIDRKLLDSVLWLDEKFSKGQAWVDLIGLANFKDLKRFEGDKLVTYARGQVVTSVRTLSERWKWSQEKVRNFLAALESDGMASTKKSAKGIVVTIENYGFYQDIARKTERKTAHSPSTDRALTEHSPRQKNNDNNINHLNNEREGARARGAFGLLSLSDEEVAAFLSKFPEDGQRYIDELDAYMAQTGKTYQNNMAALYRWAKNDKSFGKKQEHKTGFELFLEKEGIEL